MREKVYSLFLQVRTAGSTGYLDKRIEREFVGGATTSFRGAVFQTKREKSNCKIKLRWSLTLEPIF